MRKIAELEDRWKSYKYRSFIFYVFICVFVVFIVFVGLFVKSQYGKYSSIDKTKKENPSAIASVNNATTATPTNMLANAPANPPATSTTALVATPATNAPAPNATDKPLITEPSYPSISFVCRRVLANRLMVRKEPSFQSQPLGYYSKNGIFCADARAVNGLLQTNNGWISASDNFSKVVEVNMFVDSGFSKYQSGAFAQATKAPMESPIEEISVLDDKIAKPTRYPSAPVESSAESNAREEAKFTKPLINISSQKITKEQEIELKSADFKRNNSYALAIEIAEYYFGIKDYPNAIKWSLNASEADSSGKSKSQSFIIYAKSLYASGKEKQAIEVLNRYIAKTNSRDAIEALENIRQGII